MPFHAGDHPRTGAWSKITYDYCRAIQSEQRSGIFFIDHKSYFTSPVLAVGIELKEADGFRVLKSEDLKYGAQSGFSVRLPVMPSNAYLAFLTERFLSLGGIFEWRETEDIAEEADDADLLINCSGFGAKKLCRDQTLNPAKGHVLVVDNPGFHENIVMTRKDNFTHIFPWGDRCILGGVYQAGNADLTPDPTITQDILRRVSALEPAFENVVILGVRTGLRPVRPCVRLEMEKIKGGKHVIHNYGHGGAGYTLARGCAEDVLGLVASALTSSS